MNKIPQPTSIKKKSDTEMRIVWENGEESSILFRELRYHCRCAECIDEWTQKKKITREQIPSNIKPIKVENVGRYAIKILWSDKHRTGIYTYGLLYGLAQEQSLRKDDDVQSEPKSETIAVIPAGTDTSVSNEKPVE